LAEALKTPMERISTASPDTDGSPYNWGTTASRVTYMTGRAVVAAAAEIEAALKRQAGEMLECSVDDLELRPNSRVGIRGIPGKEVTFQDISMRAHWITGGPIIGRNSQAYERLSVDPKRTLAKGEPFPRIGVFGFAAMICDVEIDETTGKITVREAWSACDVGKAINPGSVEGQIEGGFVQGLGLALTEELVWDGGRLANPSLMDYKVPTSLDAPYAIHALIVEEPEPGGPFGAKGVGEICICPVPAAVANGVAIAAGVRLRRLPLTPERVLTAMVEPDHEA